ncbi:MAG: hypothetical protein R3C59_17710 [Planctomycetaceae bacterium]
MNFLLSHFAFAKELPLLRVGNLWQIRNAENLFELSEHHFPFRNACEWNFRTYQLASQTSLSYRQNLAKTHQLSVLAGICSNTDGKCNAAILPCHQPDYCEP